jgi:serine/threonine protein kinase
MATASQAFRAASAIETIDAILHDQPRWDRPIPPALKRLIKKLLEKNPDNRYQSAKAVMNALLEARAQVTEGKRLRIDAAHLAVKGVYCCPLLPQSRQRSRDRIFLRWPRRGADYGVHQGRGRQGGGPNIDVHLQGERRRYP